MSLVLRGAFAALAMTLFATGLHAQPVVTVQEDGAVAVTVDDMPILVPAVVAEGVAAAVRDHAEDPQELGQAIQMIVANNAAGPGNADLATAIAALAIFHAQPRSAITDAIMRGATAANPAVSVPMLLAALPALDVNPRARQAEDRQLAQLLATAENPAQISPVQ